MIAIAPRRNNENIGQLLILGFEGTEMTSRLSALLTKIQPAGVILFARNIKTTQQTWQLLRDCQKCVATPLFTCVDLEGGQVDRFRDVLGPAPSAADVFATGNRKLFRRHGQVIGENCHAVGFNLNFAPVLDLALEASRSVMDSRAISADPRQTSVYGRAFLAGLADKNVLGCGKHFPGLGEGKLDSHLELPVIDKSLRRLWAEDLVPYQTLRTQLPMVMISHAAYPQVTRDRVPASLSTKWITHILRKRIGYRNLIASDDLEMGAVLKMSSVGESSVAHIQAGGDLCLVCHREDFIEAAYEALANAAQLSRFGRRAAESAERTLKAKKKFSTWMKRPLQPSPKATEKLSRKLWEFSEQVRLENLVRTERQRERSVHRR